METSLNYVGEVVYTLTHNKVSDVGLIVPTLPSPRVATRASDIYDMDSYFSEYCCDEYDDDSIKWNKTSVRMFLSEWRQITYNKSVEEVLEGFPTYNTPIEPIDTSDVAYIPISDIPDIPTTDIPSTPTSDIQNLINTYTRMIDVYTSVVKDLQDLLGSRNTQAI